MRYLPPIKFAGALVLERMTPRNIRKAAGAVCGALILFLCVAAIFSLLPVPAGRVLGLVLILAAGRLLLFALECFYLSKTADRTGNAAGQDAISRLDYDAARVWHAAAGSVRGMEAASPAEIAAELARVQIGKEVLLRLGIVPVEYSAAVHAPRWADHAQTDTAASRITAFLREQNREKGEITLADLLGFLWHANPLAKNFFLAQQIGEQDLAGAGQWIAAAHSRANAQKRWWTRERLGRIPGIGKQWSFGYTVFLEQFAQPLRFSPDAQKHELIGKQREIELLESALLKTSGANVMIIGEPGTGKRTVLEGLSRMIAEGRVFPDLEHKQVLELSAGRVLGAGKTKGEIEALLLRIFSEAAAARNIIFAIDDFPEFIESLAHAGITAGALLAPFLASPAVHIIGIATPQNFRRVLQGEKGLASEFTNIELHEPSRPDLIAIIEDAVPEVESALKARVIITYPAVATVAEGAEEYVLAGGGSPQRAITLLEEAAQESASRAALFCTREIVLEYLKKKTRIPLGAIEPDEKEKLLHLEDALHGRMIGQRDAIVAISNAIRRSRAAMGDRHRPIGTFLFLGPTGVGKTETAKALAAVYFGNADAMVRFDMTEYQSESGLDRLIGSSAANQQGMLASAMRSSPYGVVLLDEFEKSHANVQDLFLQILDEGFFTDAFGERVSMRTCIVIATSNAGSVFILDALQKKMPVGDMQTGVIGYIQSRGIFKPELLNRFDSVVVFTPLGPEELKQVGRLMLEALAARLKKQNLDLAITDELIAAVATGGYSATFGARPMRRFIQDHVEKIIADKIISGTLKDGDTISLTAEDIALSTK